MNVIRLNQCVSLLATAGILSIAALTLPAHAADNDKKVAIEVEAITQSSAELSAELGKKWGTVLKRGYGVNEQGVKLFVDGYANYPADVLKSALNARYFEAMNSILMSHNQTLVNALAEKIRSDVDPMDADGHKVRADLQKALGDEARDLVYIPIASCRTFDTRFASSIGPTFNGAVTPGNPKNAYVFYGGSTSFWLAYGGTIDSCPDTTQSGGPLAGTAPYAVALNLGIVGPVGSGWVTVYRNDLADPSSTVVTQLVQTGVNDTALVVANVCRGVTGASCTADIKIASRGTSVDVAGDIVGYFIKPQATALQCTTVNGTAISVAPNTYANVSSGVPVCAAGYTSVGVDFSANADVLKADSGTNYLYVRNVSASSQLVTPKTNCCRVPGR